MLKETRKFFPVRARVIFGLLNGPFGPAFDCLATMQKKMLNRRKYTQSQKTGHEISFFWPLGGLDGLNSIEMRFYGAKMTRFNLIFQQSFFTFSMSAFEKIDISEGTSVKN